MMPPRDDRRATDAQRDRLSVTEAVRLTGLSRATISSWITRGVLPAVRLAGRRYVTPEDLLAAQAAMHGGAVVPAWRQDPVHVGRRLRAIREAAGLSQLQLAAASGLPHETLSRWERGTWVPLGRSVLRLAQALRVDPARLVSHEALGLKMLTTAEAAFRLDVPASRVQTWVKQGELPGVKVSGQWRIPAIAVAELARSGRLRGQSRRLDPRYHG
jgi:excisionase family DNA binding protein